MPPRMKFAKNYCEIFLVMSAFEAVFPFGNIKSRNLSVSTFYPLWPHFLKNPYLSARFKVIDNIL